MHIAIFDDHPAGQEKLRQHLLHFFEMHELSVEIFCPSDANDFAAAMDRTRFDLAVITLGSQVVIGFALARKLYQHNFQCEVIFVSEYSEFMKDAFAYRPIGYLLQPFSEAEISATLERFLFYHWHPNRYYTVHTRELDRLIPHREVRYFQSDGHYALIFTTTSAQSLSHLRRLDDLERELTPLGYIRCHQSYLVHLPFIRELNHRVMKLFLIDGTEIPVSKRYFNRVMTTLLAQNQL